MVVLHRNPCIVVLCMACGGSVPRIFHPLCGRPSLVNWPRSLYALCRALGPVSHKRFTSGNDSLSHVQVYWDLQCCEMPGQKIEDLARSGHLCISASMHDLCEFC